MQVNRVLINGNLVRDPEVVTFDDGSTIVNFTLAANRRYLDKSGEKKEEVSFVKVVNYGKNAERAKEYLKKGTPIMIEGRIKQERWEKDGQKNERTVVVSVQLHFFPKPKTEAAQQQPDPVDGPDNGVDIF